MPHPTTSSESCSDMTTTYVPAARASGINSKPAKSSLSPSLRSMKQISLRLLWIFPREEFEFPLAAVFFGGCASGSSSSGQWPV